MSDKLAWSRGFSLASPEKRRCLTRRSFIGLGGVAALSALVAPCLAWGGVGGGAWGAYGGTARPGAYFGYDAGWSYSYDGCVWLSASCNCTVGRVTELFLEIQVDAYVACGGIWSPTWFPDRADTPTYAYVRDHSGTWLASSFWNIDTTYDHDYYVYMTGTSLRIPRKRSDWRCWCGTDIKGLGGNAPGTHSVAEAPQNISRHVLVNDRYWQGKIVTMQPESARNLYLDASGGGRSNGTNICCWSQTDTTNQNWLVLSSAQGRTCFIPVHTGGSPLFADIASNDWGDGENLHLWSGTGGWNQSFWLHSLGTGYHMIVPECSGCAWDNVSGGTHNGNNVAQYNPYGNWNNANQHWMLKEVVFRARSNTVVSLSGKAEAGATLTCGNPAKSCLPYNYPGTSGMRYCYSWYRGTKKGACSVLLQKGESSKYRITNAEGNAYVTCVITAFARYRDVPYKGKVTASSIFVRGSWSVSYYADGSSTPCFTEEAKHKAAYTASSQALKKAAKSSCSGFEGWYLDRACSIPYKNGTPLEKDLKLYGRNRIALTYAMAATSFVVVSQQAYFLDKECVAQVSSPDTLLPKPSTHYYGASVTFSRGPQVWYEDMGRMREATCAWGAYASADGTGELMRSARLTRNTTVYLMWRTSAYDGIALS